MFDITWHLPLVAYLTTVTPGIVSASKSPAKVPGSHDTAIICTRNTKNKPKPTNI